MRCRFSLIRAAGQNNAICEPEIIQNILKRMEKNHLNNESNGSYLCLNCNAKASSLYKHTEGKFIKLFECKDCGDVVDHYVECERSIILTDLIMQESAAYKHILHNSSGFRPNFYLKLFMSIVLSEGYVRWLSQLDPRVREAVTLRNNEYTYYVVCISVIVELLFFGLVSLLLLPERRSKTPRMMCKALLLGQGGRVLNIPAIIYKRSSSPFFQAAVLAFVFVSSVQSIRAITFKDRVTTSVDVAAALAIGIIISRMFQGTFL